MLFRVSNQIQECKRRDANQLAAVGSMVNAIVVGAFGDDDGSTGLAAELDDGVIG